jgi:hypothetical protein
MTMNLKALVTSLVLLGSSTAALARPVTVSASAQGSWSWSSGPQTRDHRSPAPVRTPVSTPAPVTTFNPALHQTHDRFGWEVARPAPMLISDALTFARTEYRKDIYPSTNLAFSNLVIAANGGRTYVREVRVQFKDLSSAVIPVDRTLRGNETVTLSLGTTKPLLRVLVYRADGLEARTIDAAHPGSFTVSAF